MSDRPESTDQLLENLSALADGQLDAGAAAAVTSRWRDDQGARSAWHAYHLIGDVLRSDDLANARRDEAFLRRLRTRLIDEPVVLAPEGAADSAPAPADTARGESPGGRRRWGPPLAAAAGFLAVAGVLFVMRGVQPQGDDAGVLAAADAAGSSAQASASMPAAADERVLVVNGELVRDAQLDRYLAAHRQFGGNTALAVPSGFLRSATHEATGR